MNHVNAQTNNAGTNDPLAQIPKVPFHPNMHTHTHDGPVLVLDGRAAALGHLLQQHHRIFEFAENLLLRSSPGGSSPFGAASAAVAQSVSR